MITDWPRISTLTCKLKTNFDRRQKTEGDETYDTGLDIEDNDKRIQTENDDIVPETRDHYTGLLIKHYDSKGQPTKQYDNKEQLTKCHDSKELLTRDQDKGLENRDYDKRQYIKDKVTTMSELPYRHNTRHGGNNSRPRTHDKATDKSYFYKRYCNQPKLGYKGQKDLMLASNIYDKRRKEEHLYQSHNQKLRKFLSLILIFLSLPSATSRCITLPDNTINQKGRTARVKFSTVDCSIQKISIPLSSQETNAGLLPLQFKVYEYGTKPGEEPTTKLPDKTTDRPGQDPSPALPEDIINNPGEEVINGDEKEVTPKSEEENSPIKEDEIPVSETNLEELKVTEKLAEINLSEEDGKLLPQPSLDDVVEEVNKEIEHNDIVPVSNTGEETETDENEGQETVGEVTQSIVYGGELIENGKEPTFDNGKDIVYKEPITDEKVTHPNLQYSPIKDKNKDVKVTENLSNAIEKEKQPSTTDSTKNEHEQLIDPNVNLGTDEELGNNNEDKPNDFDIPYKDPMGQNIDAETATIKDKITMPLNDLKGKHTTLSNQKKENTSNQVKITLPVGGKNSEIIPKQEKTSEADIKITVSIDDDNSAITSTQNKTMFHFNDVMEETTKQMSDIKNELTSNPYRTMISSNEITAEITLNEKKTIRPPNADIIHLSSTSSNSVTKSNDITDEIQRDTIKPSIINISQMPAKTRDTKMPPNSNTAGTVTTSKIIDKVKSTHEGPTNVESGELSGNNKDTTHVEELLSIEDHTDKSTNGNYEMEMSHQDNPTLHATGNDAETITLEDKITTLSTKQIEQVTLEEVKQENTRTELYSGNGKTSKSVIATEKYHDNKITNENLNTVILAKATNKITGITEQIEIDTNKNYTKPIEDLDRTTEASVSKKEKSTHEATSREPHKENETTKSSKEPKPTDKTMIYISKERPTVSKDRNETNNIGEQASESSSMTEASVVSNITKHNEIHANTSIMQNGNQTMKITKISYSNIEDMTTPKMSVSGKEMTDNVQTSLQELNGANKKSTIPYMSTVYRELEKKTITNTPEKYNSIVTEDAAELVTKEVEDHLTEEHLKKEPTPYKKTMIPVIDNDEQHITKSDNESSGSYPQTQKYLSFNHSKNLNNGSLPNTMNVMEKNTIDTDKINTINMATIDTFTSDVNTNHIGSSTTISTINTIDIEAIKTLDTNDMNTPSTPAVNAVQAGAIDTDDAGTILDTGILNTVATQATIGTGGMHTSYDNTENTVNAGPIYTIDEGTKVTIETGSINTIKTGVMNTVDPYNQISTIISSTHNKYTELVSHFKQKNNPTASIDTDPTQTISDVAIKNTFEAGEINPSGIGNMNTIDKDVINTVDASVVNKYDSTYEQMSTTNIPSIMSPYTKANVSSKQTNNPTVLEVNKEHEVTTKGRKTNVSTTQDIANDKKLTQPTINSTKYVESNKNTIFSKSDNILSIEVTNDNLDKMTGSTNHNIEDLFNTMGNTKTDNLQSKYSQEVLTTSNNSEETEDHTENNNSESDLSTTPIIGELSQGVQYKTTQYHTEKNTGNIDLDTTLTTGQSVTRRPEVSIKTVGQETSLGISSSGEYLYKHTIDTTNQQKESKPTQKNIYQESDVTMQSNILSIKTSPDPKSPVSTENRITFSQAETEITLEIENDAKTGSNNQDPSTTASLASRPCECPTTSTTSKPSTTPGILTTSGTCICPDSMGGIREDETATNMPETTGRRRRRKEIEEMDLYVDNFDQKIIKKMPFLKFY